MNHQITYTKRFYKASKGTPHNTSLTSEYYQVRMFSQLHQPDGIKQQTLIHYHTCMLTLFLYIPSISIKFSFIYWIGYLKTEIGIYAFICGNFVRVIDKKRGNRSHAQKVFDEFPQPHEIKWLSNLDLHKDLQVSSFKAICR